MSGSENCQSFEQANRALTVHTKLHAMAFWLQQARQYPVTPAQAQEYEKLDKNRMEGICLAE